MPDQILATADTVHLKKTIYYIDTPVKTNENNNYYNATLYTDEALTQRPTTQEVLEAYKQSSIYIHYRIDDTVIYSAVMNMADGEVSLEPSHYDDDYKGPIYLYILYPVMDTTKNYDVICCVPAEGD